MEERVQFLQEVVGQVAKVDDVVLMMIMLGDADQFGLSAFTGLHDKRADDSTLDVHAGKGRLVQEDQRVHRVSILTLDSDHEPVVTREPNRAAETPVEPNRPCLVLFVLIAAATRNLHDHLNDVCSLSLPLTNHADGATRWYRRETAELVRPTTPPWLGRGDGRCRYALNIRLSALTCGVCRCWLMTGVGALVVAVAVVWRVLAGVSEPTLGVYEAADVSGHVDVQGFGAVM